MSEKSPRDLSRAHWQRSEGMVIFTEQVYELYPARLAEITDEEIIEALDSPYPERTSPWSHLYPRFWLSAYDLAGRFFVGWHESPQPLDESGIEEYTHYRRGTRVLVEAHETMTHFPLNLLYTLQESFEPNVPSSLHIKSLGDIGKFLRRADFRTMIDQAALAPNGSWRTRSTETGPVDRILDALHDTASEVKFTYDERHDAFAFHPDVIKQLHSFLSAVNRYVAARRFPDVHQRSSSGCPGRHTRPHFTGSPEDQQRLAALAVTFGKPEKALTAERPKSAINLGLDCLADLYKRAYRLEKIRKLRAGRIAAKKLLNT